MPGYSTWDISGHLAWTLSQIKTLPSVTLV